MITKNPINASDKICLILDNLNFEIHRYNNTKTKNINICPLLGDNRENMHTPIV